MVDLNAPVWKELHSAGNDADKLLRRLLSGEEEFREGLEIVAEDLSHQLSWYSATSYVLPHLAALCGRLSLEDRVFLICQMGAAVAAESECPLEAGTEPYREFQEGLNGLRTAAVDLIQNHMDVLKAAGQEEQQMFALGALAVLGNRGHAAALYYLSGSCWEEGPGICACGWEDECTPLTDGPDGCIKPAGIAPWDGRSLEDETVWLNGLLEAFGETEVSRILPLVYGTGVCPECGKQEPYWTWYEHWFQEDF